MPLVCPIPKVYAIFLLSSIIFGALHKRLFSRWITQNVGGSKNIFSGWFVFWLFDDSLYGERAIKVNNMFDKHFSLSDISDEVVDTAHKYFISVLLNKKFRNFRVNKSKEIHRRSVPPIEQVAEIIGCEELGYRTVDRKCYRVGNVLVFIERSELSEALDALTTIQRDVIMRSVFTDITQEQLSKEYGITKRMVQKHKAAAIRNLRRLLSEK